MLMGNSSNIPKVQRFQGNTIKADVVIFLVCRNLGENLPVEDAASLQLLEMEGILITSGILEPLPLCSNAEGSWRAGQADQQLMELSGLGPDTQCHVLPVMQRFPGLLVLC